ncbi:hypothetical protein ACH5RR_008463 [Cinchona calisaya]|uniref:Reverse transcriptase domain-containing protein n=1 Tax=Cinchona calisaya TaxID=153742 RepID=A0ABD3ABF8_9GENT
MTALHFPDVFVGWVKLRVTTASFSLNLNGSLAGYFRSEKGLRQGDPISPYLFLIAMEFFTILLTRNIRDSDFCYDPKCKSIQLTHLAFADDLLVFCQASEPSLSVIKSSLEEFGAISRVKPNLLKSSIYVAGVSNSEGQLLSEFMGMPFRDLPVTYLGLLLIPARLSFKDCQTILTKIQQTISNLGTIKLSYAGRQQLIKSVLHSIHLYWTNVFILPKRITKKIEMMLASFLWAGEIKTHYGAKVSWHDVSAPKKEGGLGLTNLTLWNECLITSTTGIFSPKK